MRKILFIYILLLCCGQAELYAQRIMSPDGNREMINGAPDRMPNGLQDDDQYEDTTTQVDASTIPIDVKMFTLSERFGDIRPVQVDTVNYNFQNTNLVEGMNGENNYLGNMGSPAMSRIFLNRKQYSNYLFLDPYFTFINQPQDFILTNTKSPFTNISYYSAGSKVDGEDRFKAQFAVNVNKQLGFGFKADYLYGRGLYADQSTAHFAGSLFGYYNGDRYKVFAIYTDNSLKMAENGGIEDDRYITDPQAMSAGRKEFEARNIPTRFSRTWNRNKNYYVFLTQRYNLGFERELPQPVKAKTDTTGVTQAKNVSKKEFIPVTSFIHTLKLEQSRRRFLSYENPTDFYENNFFDVDSTNDYTKQLSAKNTVAIALKEGFSKWAKVGLTAFASYDFRKYSMADTLTNRNRRFDKQYKENTLSIGGELSKKMGTLLHYNAVGEIALAGTDIGQFSLEGGLDLNIPLFNDTVQLVAKAFMKNTNPAFYLRHYHSNHYWWDNKLDKEFRTRIEGELSIKRWRTNLRVGIENLKNYAYFGNADIAYTNKEGATFYKNDVRVMQNSKNIQVFTAILKQDFKVGILHLDNEITYQKSSSQSVLPLPELSLYHNLYLQTKLAKVLTLQLGADVRYFTEYNAPDYSAPIGQYYLQNSENSIKIGGFPIVNVYANLHLKRTRFFAMMYHLNSGMGSPKYFLAPHYPINPSMFKIGISWNFFD